MSSKAVAAQPDGDEKSLSDLKHDEHGAERDIEQFTAVSADPPPGMTALN